MTLSPTNQDDRRPNAGAPSQGCGHESDLVAISKELADTYEQINLLYKLGRSMNWLTRPGDFVNMACRLLLDTLQFSWIAFKHGRSDATGAETAPDLVVAGELECPREPFDTLAAKMLGEILDDQGTMVLEPADHDLAALVGSQVIAEPVMSGGRVAALILAGGKGEPDPEVTSNDIQLLDATAEHVGAFLHNVALYAQQREMFLGTIKALTAAIDAKDRYTRGHSERVALTASALARACGFADEQVEMVRIAGLVHDVGKIGVPEVVLRKPGRLTDVELEQIKSHPRIGHNILKDIAALKEVLPGVLHHHEWWDGQGYPEGLSGKKIPQIARMLALADAFDAMSSARSYRAALSRAQVIGEITEFDGIQFDPELTKIFVTLDFSEYDALVDRHLVRESKAA